MSLLPGEILLNITQSLTAQDLLQCLTVCQNWYFALLYQLYQHINITNNHQALLLLEALQRVYSHQDTSFKVGHYVKSISFRTQQKVNLGLGIQLRTKDPVRVTQLMLDIIERNCPYIESLDYDYTQWKLSKESLRLPSRLLQALKKLPAVDFSVYRQAYNRHNDAPNDTTSPVTLPTTITKLNNHLTTLHIRNNTELFEPDTLIDFLSHIPQVQHLTFERDDVFNKYRTPILSLELLKTILKYLPQLDTLQFTNHFNFGTELSPPSSSSLRQFYYDPEHVFLAGQQHLNPYFEHDNSRNSLKHLKLEGTLRSYHWLSYIAEHLQQLRSIDFDLVLSPYSSNPSLSYNSSMMPSTHFVNAVIKESFVRLATHCRQLSYVRVRGISTPLWLSPLFLSGLRQQHPDTVSKTVIMDAQLYGLDSLGVQNAITTLTHGTMSDDLALTSLPLTRNIQLSSLRLPIWKTNYPNPCIKNWTITLAPLMAKFSESLTHLELDAVSLSFNSNHQLQQQQQQQQQSSRHNYSEGNTSSYHTQPYELDTLLNMFTNLVSLKLSGSAVELSKNATIITSMEKHSRFKELQLFKMLFTTAIMDYLSTCCPNTTRVILYECTHWSNKKKKHDSLISSDTARSIGKVPLPLRNLRLDVLVLYRLQHAHHTTVEGRAPGARFLCYTNSAEEQQWYHLVKKEDEQVSTTTGTAAVLKPLTSTHIIQTIVEHTYQYVLGLLHGYDNTLRLTTPTPFQRRIEYHPEAEWEKDLAFGYIDLQCKGVKKVFLDESSLDM